LLLSQMTLKHVRMGTASKAPEMPQSHPQTRTTGNTIIRVIVQAGRKRQEEPMNSTRKTISRAQESPAGASAMLAKPGGPGKSTFG
jgi:hypothetical protein